MIEAKLHNIQFYNFTPQAIHCLAYNEKLKVLALARLNCSIEIWDCQDRVFKLQEFIPEGVSSIEALVWCDSRLLSAGLNGFITEHVIGTSEIANKTATTGGPIWCLALSPNTEILAAGTEEGYVGLFNVTSEGLTYNSILDRQQGRVLSIGWHTDGKHLVTGSIDLVHLFNIDKGQILQFPVGRTFKNTETIVWCTALLDDMTIVTGDSRGKTCFWSGEHGTLLDGVESHQASILCMNVRPDQKSVYVAGTDPVIVQINLVQVGRSKSKHMWVKGVHRRIHTHDVRAMVLTPDDRLFTAGVDTYLVQSYYPPKTAIKYVSTPPKGYIGYSRSNSVLLGYEDRVELWRLGVVGKANYGRYLPIKEDRIKLLDLHLNKGEKLHSCALSPSGTSIAYIVKGKIRVYSLTLPTKGLPASIKKCKTDQKALNQSDQIYWIDDKTIASFSNLGQLQLLCSSKETWEVNDIIDIPDEKAPLLVAISAKATGTLACVDACNRVHVIDTKTKILSTLPSVKWKISAIAIDGGRSLVFTAHSNLQLLEYNYKQKQYTELTEHMKELGFDWFKRNISISTITYANNNCIYLQDTNNIHVLNRESRIVTSNNRARPTKQRKLESDGLDMDNAESMDVPLTASKALLSSFQRSNNVMFATCSSENDMISFELNPIALLDKLPPPLKQKKFGGS